MPRQTQAQLGSLWGAQNAALTKGWNPQSYNATAGRSVVPPGVANQTTVPGLGPAGANPLATANIPQSVLGLGPTGAISVNAKTGAPGSMQNVAAPSSYSGVLPGVAATSTPAPAQQASNQQSANQPTIQGFSPAQYNADIGGGTTLLDMWNFYPNYSGWSLDQMKSYNPSGWAGLVRNARGAGSGASGTQQAQGMASPYAAPTAPNQLSSLQQQQIQQATDRYNAAMASNYGSGNQLPGGGYSNAGTSPPELGQEFYQLQAAYAGNTDLFNRLYGNG